MDIIQSKTNQGKTTELIKRYAQDEDTAILISNGYTVDRVREICVSKLGYTEADMEKYMSNKTFFHLESDTAESLSRVVLEYLDAGIKKFYVDGTLYNLLLWEDRSIQSIINAETYYDSHFTIVASFSDREGQRFNAVSEKYKDYINLTKI